SIEIKGTAIGTTTVGSTIHYNGATVSSYLDLRPFIETAIRAAASDPAVPNGLRPLLANATVDLIGAGTATSPAHFLVRLGAHSRPYDPSAVITLTGAIATAKAVALTGAGVLINPQQFSLTLGSDGPLPAPGTLFRPVQEKFFAGKIADKTGM